MDEVCRIIRNGATKMATKTPMAQTIAQWRYLYSLAEKAMLRDKEEISRLKMKINKLEQQR